MTEWATASSQNGDNFMPGFYKFHHSVVDYITIP